MKRIILALLLPTTGALAQDEAAIRAACEDDAIKATDRRALPEICN